MATSMTTSPYLTPHSATSTVDIAQDRPNATFFFYAPLVMVAAGLVAWLRPDNSTFLLCTFIGSFVAMLSLWDLLILEGPIRFSRIWSMTLLLGYAFGALNSWYTIPRGILTVAQFFIQDPAALARAQGTVLFACAALFIAGEIWEKPLFSRNYKLTFDSHLISFCILSTLITLAAYATKQLVMGIVVSGATHELRVLPALAVWCLSPAFALTVAAAVAPRSLTSRVMLGALAAVQMVCILPLGRGRMLYSLILAIVATRFAGIPHKIPLSKKLGALALAGVLFYAGNVTFYYLRVTTWHTKSPGVHLSIVQLGSATLAYSQQTRAEDVLGALHENEQTRTFILGYFSDVLDASLNHLPAYGLDLMHQINLAIPRVINPGKTNQRYLSEEQIAGDVYGLKSSDQANSVLTGGAIDFGFLGVLSYPIVLALLISAGFKFFFRFVPGWIGATVVLAMIMSFLAPEAEFGDLLNATRDSLLFGVVLVAISAMPRVTFSPTFTR